MCLLCQVTDHITVSSVDITLSARIMDSLPTCWDTLPTAFFAYRHSKKRDPAIRRAAISLVITRCLLYIVLLYKCIDYMKYSR